MHHRQEPAESSAPEDSSESLLSKFSRGRRKDTLPGNVWVATAASFLTDISSEMVAYLIPLFLAGVLKTSTVFIGLIEGVAEATASLMKLFSGYLSDIGGRRKWLVVLGYSVSTISKALLVSAGSWRVVFAARFGDRVGKGIRTSPRDALLAESVDKSVRGRAFGFHRAGDTLGAFIGIGLAALIVYLTHEAGSTALSHRTFTVAVVFSVIVAALAVVVLAVGLRDIRAVESRPLQSAGRFNNRFKLFLLITAIFTLGNSADAFIVLRAYDNGASVLTILFMVMGFNLIYALGAHPFGKLSDRLGRRRVIICGWIVYSLSYLGFAATSRIAPLAVLWAVYGLYYAMTEGAGKAYVADLVDVSRRGAAYGWYHAVIGLTALPASLVAGFLWHRFDPAVPFLFGAVLAGIAAVLLAFLNQLVGEDGRYGA